MGEGRYGDKAKGIIDGLEDSEKNSDKVNEEKSKRADTEKNNSLKDEKKKRSFMLTESQVEKLYMLKAKNSDRTLSAMVGEVIEEYYKRHMNMDQSKP